MSKQDIISLYDYSMRIHSHSWNRNLGNLAIHYGLWEDGIKSREDAMLNTNRVLANKGKIKAGDRILDAGCGVGGSSIWLAQHFRTSVVGVTLSDKEVKKARELANEFGVADLVRFEALDYTKTDFPSGSFDVIWAIESTIYAEDKTEFVNEAYRLLKPKGRLILADAFIKRDPDTDQELGWVETFKNGFAVPNIISNQDFTKTMEKTGYSAITTWDVTEQIMPSVRMTRYLCLVGYPFTALLSTIKVTSPLISNNNAAGIVQYDLYAKGVFMYGIVYGEK